jgi:electron transfer flavoprotein beta subunit
MDVVVCMKLVPDLKQLRIKRETREPVLEGVPFVWGDMDRNALEEGLRLRERHGGRVTALAVGTGKMKEAMVEALAMGADDGILVSDSALAGLDTAATAGVLAAAIMRRGAFDLVLAGEGSTDGYSGQVGPRLAELLDVPQMTYVRELSVSDGKLRGVRNLEDCLEVVECSLPAVATVTQEINTPRLPALTAILRASRKPQVVMTLAELGLAGTRPVVERIRNLAPEQARKNILFEGDDSVSRLLAALAREGVLGG